MCTVSGNGVFYCTNHDCSNSFCSLLMSPYVYMCTYVQYYKFSSSSGLSISSFSTYSTCKEQGSMFVQYEVYACMYQYSIYNTFTFHLILIYANAKCLNMIDDVIRHSPTFKSEEMCYVTDSFCFNSIISFIFPFTSDYIVNWKDDTLPMNICFYI
jgi:hypothetical protein